MSKKPLTYAQKFAKKGGHARAKALTKARRRAISKSGAAARWKMVASNDTSV